jgi:hypothetical protein
LAELETDSMSIKWSKRILTIIRSLEAKNEIPSNQLIRYSVNEKYPEFVDNILMGTTLTRYLEKLVKSDHLYSFGNKSIYYVKSMYRIHDDPWPLFVKIIISMLQILNDGDGVQYHPLSLLGSVLQQEGYSVKSFGFESLSKLLKEVEVLGLVAVKKKENVYMVKLNRNFK